MTSNDAQVALLVLGIAIAYGAMFPALGNSEPGKRVARWLWGIAVIFAAPALITLWRIALLGG